MHCCGFCEETQIFICFAVGCLFFSLNWPLWLHLILLNSSMNYTNLDLPMTLLFSPLHPGLKCTGLPRSSSGQSCSISLSPSPNSFLGSGRKTAHDAQHTSSEGAPSSRRRRRVSVPLPGSLRRQHARAVPWLSCVSVLLCHRASARRKNRPTVTALKCYPSLDQKSIAIPAGAVALTGQQCCERFGQHYACLLSPEPPSFSPGT